MAGPVQPDPLVLATSSPRRLSLMREAGYRFTVQANELIEPEPRHANMTPGAYAEAIAFFKAASVARQHPAATILGADTTTVIGDDVYSKPRDRAHAEQMLRRLSGTEHRVVTGVALFDPARNRRLMGHDITTIGFRQLSDAQVAAYLDTGEWEGKAGAYGIQARGDAFVQSIAGSFSNVVGLPLELVARLFDQWCSGRACGD